MSNALDNLLDIIVFLFLFLGIGLISFAFTFSFSLVPIYQAASAVGLHPFDFVTKEFIVDSQTASMNTLLNTSLVVLPLIAFVLLRRRILTPLTLGDLILLLIVASPLPIWLLVNAFDLRLCIFPLSSLMSDGAVIFGKSKDSFHFCEPLIESDNPAANVFRVFKALYTIALVPLNMAVLSSIGLTGFGGSRATIFRLRNVAWPLHWLRNLIPAVVARISRQEFRSVLWLLLFAIAVPAAALFSLLPSLSTVEVKAVLTVIPIQYRDGPVAELLVGFYAGPGRQLLLLVLILVIWFLFVRRWFAALSLIMLTLLFPLSVYYLLTNHYLLVTTSGHFLVFGLFVLLSGWAGYVASQGNRIWGLTNMPE